MKYITVKLTENQVWQIITSLENDYHDYWADDEAEGDAQRTLDNKIAKRQNAYLQRIVTKLAKAKVS